MSFKNKLLNRKEENIKKTLAIFREKSNALLKDHGIQDEKEQTDITVKLFGYILRLYQNRK